MLKGTPDPFEHIEICEKMRVDWVRVQNEITSILKNLKEKNGTI